MNYRTQKMQNSQVLKVDKLVVLAILLLNLLRGVTRTLGNSAGNSHYRIDKDRRLADQSSGVIKIDCGGDPDKIPPGYVTDDSFIDTGKNMVINSQYSAIGLDPVLSTVRSFPDGKRNCYTLNPSGGPNTSYLIQLRFMYGNYDQLNRIPTFNIYIGVNLLWTFSLNDAMYQNFVEMIYKPITEYIYICFVNIGQGTPFVSEIILRPLDSSSIYQSDLGALQTSICYHSLKFSSSDDPKSFNYERNENDKYVRFWAKLPQEFQQVLKIYSLIKDLTTLENDEYEIPASILQSRLEPQSGNNTMMVQIKPHNPTDVHYLYWHFIEIEKLGEGEVREFTISMYGNITLGPFTPEYLKALTVISPPLRLESGESMIWFSINATNRSTLPPILNALEFMILVNVSHETTNPDDVKAILEVKRNYSFITGWQADPCRPKCAWDGLICSNNNNEPPTITSLNLSSKGLTGEILPSLSGLTSLTSLDLSHNALTGMIPEFLAKMPSLRVLNLRGNNLSGSIPVALMDKVKNNFLSLSLDENPDLCTANSCAENKRKKPHILAPLVATSTSLIVILIFVFIFYTIRWRKRGLIAHTKNYGRMKSNNRQFTYSEVIQMTNNFQRVIGKGSYGTVYYGSLKEGTEVAVKILNQPSALMSFHTEAELLMRVHHKNLVSLIGYCSEGESMSLIYEYMANGNLKDYLSMNSTSIPSWKERLQIAIDAAQGLDYLHNGCKPAIVHRDMKTANILLDGKLKARIADFGMSKIFATESASHISTENVVGTPGYLDPEYHVSLRLNEKSDVYSFGVILLELLTGKPAVIRGAAKCIHISDWVTPLLHKGEIHSIVDQRLGTDFNINSAWKFLEIAMSCGPTVGIQRPTIAQVFVDLKDCLELELVHEKGKDINSLTTSIDDC